MVLSWMGNDTGIGSHGGMTWERSSYFRDITLGAAKCTRGRVVLREARSKAIGSCEAGGRPMVLSWMGNDTGIGSHGGMTEINKKAIMSPERKKVGLVFVRGGRREKDAVLLHFEMAIE